MMAEDTDESTITTKTFRFASGQTLTLDDDQIQKIPYLTALVSADDHFESVCDENSYYKLDPYIDYNDFLFVLESVTFHSVRQLFTQLPKQNNVISIIALIDFLGLGPQPDPTLNEVDSIFFSTIVYSPMLKQHLQIVRPNVIQDMAVRFAIGIVKEKYDFTDDKVLDQLYWFIMFILSAYEYFGSRLRYHVYTIAQNCFSIFKPSLLKPLRKLIHRAEINVKTFGLNTNGIDLQPDEENKVPLEQNLSLDEFNRSDEYIFSPNLRLRRRQNLLLYHTYTNYDSFWYWPIFHEEDHLEPVYKRVLEIMYERLQNEICQCAIMEIRRNNNISKSIQKTSNLESYLYLFEKKSLPKAIENIFKSKSVQEEICEYILEGLQVIIPKIKNRHAELLRDIQTYAQYFERRNEIDDYGFFSFFLYPFSDFESMQEQALSYELLLDKAHEGSSLVEQIKERVVNGLRTVAMERFNQWIDTQYNINELYHYLLLCPIQEKDSSDELKIMRQERRIPSNKRLPKHQLKPMPRRYKAF